jgi:putative restriction endonuclease
MGLLLLAPIFIVMISGDLIKFEKEDIVRDFFNRDKNQKIILPDKFFQTREILDYLHNNIFRI